MAFDNVYLVNSRLHTATAQDVRQAEEALGVSFPVGYAAFVTNLGEGIYSGFVRVYPPSRVVAEHRDFQARWAEYFHWGCPEGTLRRDEVLESVIIADTLHGDEFIIHPQKPERVFVLPRYQEDVLVAGTGLVDSIQWACKSGDLTQAPIGFDHFESWQSRERTTLEGTGAVAPIATALVSLRLHDYYEETYREEDPFAQLFYSSFQGSVDLTDDGSWATAWVTNDVDSRDASLDAVLNCLRRHGMRPKPD